MSTGNMSIHMWAKPCDKINITQTSVEENFIQILLIHKICGCVCVFLCLKVSVALKTD